MVKPVKHTSLSSVFRGAAVGVAACLAVVAGPGTANAVPSFARAYEMPCSACHTAWPLLNSFGRQFKENGYMIARGEPQGMTELNDYLSIPEVPPLAVRFNSRPFDNNKDGPSKTRALHSVTFFTAGNFSKYGSFWSELEMEDENDFDPKLENGFVGLHPHQALNIVLGYSSAFTADPYITLRGIGRLTRGRASVFEKGTTTGFPKLKNSEQFVSLYGRDPFTNKVFYLVTFARDVDDPEGEGAHNVLTRLAIDILPQLTVGGFNIIGREDTAAEPNQDFRRWGVDATFEVENFSLRGVWMRAKDDGPTGMPGGTTIENDVGYVEAFYAIRTPMLANLPVPIFQVVPLLRVDSFEKNDGNNDETTLTANLGVYPFENLRVNFEYFTSLDEPAARRLTLFLELLI